MFAYDLLLGMSYPAYAFVMTCTYSWFRIIGKYRTVATVMIMAGVIAAYLGTVLFSVAPILGSLLTLLGYFITIRFFSEGSEDFPVKI